eukprot:CAMPEP_0170639742 /NCGR_PEP_ID=MMETSP0224-20130122/39823_1 /TAXON_ID=285029 /ORGANISM="Togula jolla, Strain CCCM 725" /LENGTH=54 /DNA_ID=CAMNT_0010970141 /DNA_START=179 /DNA_END=343 /DNA_ORIENTATION=+
MPMLKDGANSFPRFARDSSKAQGSTLSRRDPSEITRHWSSGLIAAKCSANFSPI